MTIAVREHSNLLGSGSDLLSRAVSSQVPSAREGLTSVFGMGTGGTLQPLPPEIFCVVGYFRTLKTAQEKLTSGRSHFASLQIKPSTD